MYARKLLALVELPHNTTGSQATLMGSSLRWLAICPLDFLLIRTFSILWLTEKTEESTENYCETFCFIFREDSDG